MKNILENGNIFEGELKDGYPYGEGVLIYATGDEKIESGEEKGFFDKILINGYANLSYRNGMKYTGDIKFCQKHGKGVLETDQIRYEGDFFEGIPQGKGKMIVNGVVYEGDFVKFQLNGKGKAVCPSGETYEGDWRNGVRHGFGKMLFKDGNTYEGEFKEDNFCGKGIYKTKTTTIKAEFKKDGYFGYGVGINKDIIYYGEFNNNQQHGNGMYKNLKDGSIFKGKFENGKILKGRKYFKNEKIEEVEYADGNLIFIKKIDKDGSYVDKTFRKNGTLANIYSVRADGKILKNTLVAEDGREIGPAVRIYTTQIINGKEVQIENEYTTKPIPSKKYNKINDEFEKNVWELNSIIDRDLENLKEPAKLICNLMNLDKFDGKIKNRLPNGKGTYKFFRTGNIFEGNIKNGLPEGKGKYTFNGGNIYVGDFKGGFPTGKAEIIYIDGAKYTGEVYKLLHHGKGKYTLSNGNSFEGEFKNGAPNGYGVMINNGNTFKGYFVNGSYVGDTKPKE